MSTPEHYNLTPEPLEAIESWGLSFSLGNVVKYIVRAGRKTPDALEDLKKAQDYLTREIARRLPPPAAKSQAEAESKLPAWERAFGGDRMLFGDGSRIRRWEHAGLYEPFSPTGSTIIGGRAFATFSEALAALQAAGYGRDAKAV